MVIIMQIPIVLVRLIIELNVFNEESRIITESMVQFEPLTYQTCAKSTHVEQVYAFPVKANPDLDVNLNAMLTMNQIKGYEKQIMRYVT